MVSARPASYLNRDSIIPFQASYLNKERSIAPWEVAHNAFVSISKRLIPRNETDVRRRFTEWVNNLVMPYFYETGGFRMVGRESKEEMQLKAKIVNFACNVWGLKACLVDAQKQFFAWMDGRTEKKRSTAT